MKMQKLQFNYVQIETFEKWFRFANITLDKALEEVFRYYAEEDIKQIKCY